MKVGDKVRVIKGEHLGNVGIITDTLSKAMRITVTDYGEEKAEYEDNYVCETDDGTIFFGFQDDLELLE